MAELLEPLFNNLFIWLLLLAIPILPNLWSIWHAFFRVFPSDAERLAWIGACVFIPVLGGIAYILVGRRRAAKPAAANPQETAANEAGTEDKAEEPSDNT